MFRRGFGLVLLVTSLGVIAEDVEVSVADQAPVDAWQVLEKSAFAARELNYEGQFSYINGEQTRTVEITHMNYGGREVARNIVLDGNQREVYSKGNDIVIFQPTNNNVIIKKRRGQNLFPAMLPTNLSVIKANYSAALKGTEFVANREAQIVELMPADAYRYSYKIWTDIKFGLILKMALLTASNKTLEQIYFNKLSMLNSQNLNWFEPKIDMSKSYVTEEDSSITRVENDWIVTNLPAGYSKIDHIQRVVPGKKTVMDQLIFSDGIASVSVFIEPLTKGKRPKKGHMLMGSTNMCANVIDGHQVIVVGEVPEKTVQSIARAVSLKK
ncbi:MAG: MucB/RseB C-terminal domain-containing protein [Methylophilaceae bacterium]